jgi:Xaa-Pro aminopeptidase
MSLGLPDARSRLAALAAGLAELDCQGLVVFAESAADPDMAPFTGAVHVGQSLLVVPRDGEPRLAYLTAMERDEAAATGLALLTPAELDVVRFQAQATEPADFFGHVLRNALKHAGLPPGRVALAGHGPAGVLWGTASKLAREGYVWVPGNSLLQTLRKGKTAAELAGLRRASAGTAEAMRAAARLLAAAEERGGELHLEGRALTVGRIRREVGQVLAGHGLEQPRGNLVAPAEEGAAPHSTGTDERVLRPHESLVVDLFPKGTLFADCTRTFCVGAPPEPLAKAYGAVARALETARAAARPGVRGWDLQEAVCRGFQEDGYATPLSHPGTTVGYVHNLGHGVGFDIHEAPTFRKANGAEGVLGPGDVFTLEPGLYDAEERYAVRLEDLYALTPEGLENLTPLPYELDPRAWPA